MLTKVSSIHSLQIIHIILHFQLDAVALIIFPALEFLISIFLSKPFKCPLVAKKRKIEFLLITIHSSTYFALQLFVTPSIATGRYGNSNLNTIVIAQFHKYDNSIWIVKPPYELFLGHLVLVDSLQGVINLLVGGVEAVAVILGRPHVRGG